MAQDRVLDPAGRFLGVAMGAAQRLRDDLVDDLELEEVLSCESESLGRLLRLVASFQRIAAQPSGVMTE